MPKFRIASAACAAALFAGLTPAPAHAQLAVVDLKVIVQAEQQVNLLNAQLQQLKTDITGPIQQIASQATGILQQAQGIGYGAQNIASQYASLYPQSMPGASLATTQASLATWRNNNIQALQAGLAMQNAIARGQPTTTSQVQAAVTASQGAAGQTSAIQATNQLLATVTAQLTQLQNLLITQARAEQTLAAQVQSSQATGQADSDRAWNYTPPVSRVQNPGQL